MSGPRVEVRRVDGDLCLVAAHLREVQRIGRMTNGARQVITRTLSSIDAALAALRSWDQQNGGKDG